MRRSSGTTSCPSDLRIVIIEKRRPQPWLIDRNVPPAGGRKGRRKVCSFCVDKIDTIDYKDVARLRRFVSERAKILPRRVTGTCARHQRELTVAIKRARQIALMPFVSE